MRLGTPRFKAVSLLLCVPSPSSRIVHSSPRNRKVPKASGLLLRLGLRFHCESLRTNAAADAKSDRWRASTIQVFGTELRDNPFRRRRHAEFTKSRVIGHIAGGASVAVETSLTCVSLLVTGRIRCGIKLPEIGRLIVVQFLAAGRLPKPGNDSVDILPDELIDGPRGGRRILSRRPATAQSGTKANYPWNSHSGCLCIMRIVSQLEEGSKAISSRAKLPPIIRSRATGFQSFNPRIAILKCQLVEPLPTGFDYSRVLGG